MFISIALLSLLTCSLVSLHGDVKSNPGSSYTVDRAVLGTFHQGD